MKYYHEHWPRKRKERLEIDGYRCQTCLHDGSRFQLEVHHKTYDRWRDEDVCNDLITLCCECHKAITNVIRKRRYESRKYKIGFVGPIESNGELRNGLARKKVQVDWYDAHDNAQWANGLPDKQVGAFDKGDFVETQQDRCRL